MEGFKFPLWRSTAFRVRLEESINKRHSAGLLFSDKHLKSPSILLQKQSRSSTEKQFWRTAFLLHLTLADFSHSDLTPTVQLYPLRGMGL